VIDDSLMSPKYRFTISRRSGSSVTTRAVFAVASFDCKHFSLAANKVFGASCASALQKAPGLPTTELARRSFVTPQTMIRIVANLGVIACMGVLLVLATVCGVAVAAHALVPEMT